MHVLRCAIFVIVAAVQLIKFLLCFQRPTTHSHIAFISVFLCFCSACCCLLVCIDNLHNLALSFCEREACPLLYVSVDNSFPISIATHTSFSSHAVVQSVATLSGCPLQFNCVDIALQILLQLLKYIYIYIVHTYLQIH